MFAKFVATAKAVIGAVKTGYSWLANAVAAHPHVAIVVFAVVVLLFAVL